MQADHAVFQLCQFIPLIEMSNYIDFACLQAELLIVRDRHYLRYIKLRPTGKDMVTNRQIDMATART